MKKLIGKILLVSAGLFCLSQRLPAPPVELPSETPASTPKPKIHKRARSRPTPEPTVMAAESVDQSVAGAAIESGSPTPSAVPSDLMRETAYDDDDGNHYVYTLTASQPFGSRASGQKIVVKMVKSGVRDLLQDGKTFKQPFTSTATTTINTGRTKSLVQLCNLMKDAFSRFVAGNVTPGQEVGKIGDARYGGELRFVAENADSLRFDYVPATATALSFRRMDIQKFLELIKQ